MIAHELHIDNLKRIFSFKDVFPDIFKSMTVADYLVALIILRLCDRSPKISFHVKPIDVEKLTGLNLAKQNASRKTLSNLGAIEFYHYTHPAGFSCVIRINTENIVKIIKEYGDAEESIGRD